jgi:hypothetical protein
MHKIERALFEINRSNFVYCPFVTIKTLELGSKQDIWYQQWPSCSPAQSIASPTGDSRPSLITPSVLVSQDQAVGEVWRRMYVPLEASRVGLAG